MEIFAQGVYGRQRPFPVVQLRPATPIRGAAAFRDGCGTRYDFFLPPDGPGGYVVVTEPNGARSEWHRRV